MHGSHLVEHPVPHVFLAVVSFQKCRFLEKLICT
jgi:hypothetical protein